MSETKNKKRSRKKSKKKESWKDKICSFFTSTVFLSIIFGLLVCLVISLVFVIHQRKEGNLGETKANIVIPIYKADSDFEFSISAVDLKKSKKYIFKVVNYMKDIVNDEDISYKIVVKNPTDSVITMTKNDSKENLISSQEETVLENEILHSGEEDEVFYYIQYDKCGKLKEKDLITINIHS